MGDLVDEGLLERTPGGEYQLGMRLFELGQMAPRQRGLREAVAPFLTDLRDATRETVHFAVMDGFEVVYVDIIQATHAPRLQSRVGGRMPVSVTGLGKAMLAFSPPELIEAVIADGLPRLTRYSIVSAPMFRAELANTLRTGTATDNQENALGTTCCASPIFGADNRVIAAVSVSGHTSALRVERVGAAVRSTAMAISRAQGSTRPLIDQRLAALRT